jgi:hypothetical protein
VEEPQEVLAEVPFACAHGGSEETDGVVRGVVKLFEVVQDEEVGGSGDEKVGGEADLEERRREEKGEKGEAMSMT